MKDSQVLKTPVPEQKLASLIHSFLCMLQLTVDDFNLCDGLECEYVKYKSRASTACELPDLNTCFFAS